MSGIKRIAATLTLAAVLAAGATASEALARTASKSSASVNIGNDRGGYVIKYALRMMKIRNSGKQVKFSGSCASACTLFLALPKDRSCLTKNASFRFHLPYGTSQRGVKVARNYMLNNYPRWVRSWIKQKGGLSNRLITMNASYASKFIKSC